MRKPFAVRAAFLLLALLFASLERTAYAVRSETERSQAAAGTNRVTVPETAPTAEQARLIQAARRAGIAVRWDSSRGVPASIRGTDLGVRGAFSAGRGLTVGRSGDFAADAVAVLDNVSGLLRARDASHEFVTRAVSADRLGFHHARVNQVYEGLRVVGAEMLVHFDGNNRPYEINGRYIPGISVDPAAKLSADEAVAAAQADLARMELPAGESRGAPESVVYARRAPARLAYEVMLTYKTATGLPGRWLYWIDAHTGRVIERFNNIHHIPAPTTNGALVALQGSVLAGEGGGATNVVGWYDNVNTNYYLYNTNWHWIVENVATNGYSDNNTYAYRATTNWGASDRTEISAANAIDVTLRYYNQIHGLNSFGGTGNLARVNVHEGTDYVNAYWDGSELYFGDGDGVDANGLAVQDVAGHEFTHAVTEYSANLSYSYESGALNESFSDVFGACTEFFAQTDDRASYPSKNAGRADWLLGEDCWLSSTSLRDMRNPANTVTVGSGNEQPTRYQGTYWYFGAGDNGGVHYNSGVQNFFFYLLCEGGSGDNDGIAYNVPGLGITNAQQIAFRALTVYCTADTDYRDVRGAWLSAAQDLNASWVSVVSATWDAVGVAAVSIDPLDAILFSGSEGGPFAPTSFVFIINNSDANAAGWGVTNTQAWLTVSPSGGMIPALGSVAVTATVNAAANSLPGGSYFDALLFTNSASAVTESRGVELLVLPPVVYSFELNANPGWSTSGEWAFGAPQGQGGTSYGYPDPTAGATGPNVYGVNLGGDYSTTIGGPFYLTAGPFDFSDYSGIQLGFNRWLNTDYQPYVTADLQISTDGTTWTTLWSNPLGEEVADSGWSRIVEDISSYADGNSAVYVRWGYQVLLSGAYAYSGWNLDDITFYGAPLDAMQVMPPTGYSASGYEGGPFSPTSATWTIVNNEETAFTWTAQQNAAWLDLSASGGTLAGGESTTVVATLNTVVANALPTNTYTASIAFSNVTSGFKTTRPLSLTVLPIPGEIEVTDSIPPATDLAMPFGEVIIGTKRSEMITITNTDSVYPLVISNIVLTGLSEDPESFAPLTATELPTHAAVGGERNFSGAASLPSAKRWISPIHSAATANILVYADEPVHLAPATFVDQALQGLGLPYTAYYDGEYGDFEAALTNAGPWDLVILAADNWSAPSTTLDALLAYVNGGGRLIAHAWNVNGGHALWNAMGVSFVSDVGDPPDPVYWWSASHPLFNQPEGVPQFTSLDGGIFGVYGQNVNAIGDGVALAGYALTETAGQAGLIVANEGRTIFRGFLDAQNSADLDADDKSDGMELWENLISYSLAGLAFHLENLPSLPHSLGVGEAVSFNVVYEPEYPGTNYGRVTIYNNDADEPAVEVQLSGVGIEDYLQVSPATGLISSGHPGGPFDPDQAIYVLTNTFISSIDWTASSTQAWVAVAPSGGTLGVGGSQVVTVKIVAASAPVTDGIYRDTVVFSNVTTTATRSRNVELTIFTSPIVQVAPSRLDVTNRLGESQFRTMVISNAPSADGSLSFTVRARVTNQPPQALRSRTELPDLPPGHDFTRVAPGVAYRAGELLVRFVPGLTTAQREQALVSLGGATVRREYNLVRDLYLVTLPAGQTVEDALPAYNAASGVVYAEPNYVVHVDQNIPNDALFGDLWGMSNTGQSSGTVDADIDAPEAWALYTGDPAVIVAVIDTGIDYAHEDLATNMWINPGEIAGNNIDDDNNGYIDDVYGINMITGSGDPLDDHDHGTHCAGTIGAVGNNEVGVAGVSWRVRLMACKFLDSSGYGSTADAITCVDYAASKGARVMSASWGGGGYSQALKDSIEAAGALGALFCAAAGNDGVDTDVTPNYPSSFTSSNIVAVMATDRNDARSGFSNYGLTSVDLGAPGSSIMSCKRGGGYQLMSGTSMATPHVSGAAALLLAANPLLSPQDLKDTLMNNVDSTLSGQCVSGGRMNIAAALAEVGSSWISFNPASGSNVPPGSAATVSVGFHAGELTPGLYEADIIVASNDRTNPIVTIPATMTVLSEGLFVSPSTVVTSTGYLGGPFSPSAVYTLSNATESAINWTAGSASNWITIASGGILAAGSSTQVTVSVNANANALTTGTYEASTIFSNVNSGATRARIIELVVGGPPPPIVWVNEINYDTPGNDSNEFVEVAGVAGTDLSAFRLILYNGANAALYSNIVLSGSVDDEGCGYGAIAFDTPAIQNGSPDGVVLARVASGVTSLVQFLSYEGVMTITNASFGVATSQNIGTQNSIANDLQLAGTGREYAVFAWKTNALSKGVLNAQQTISPCGNDQDGDGLPDWWETQYGLNPSVSNAPTANADGDWMTDLEEYWADTVPTNGASSFPLVVLTNPPGGIVSLVVDPSSTARVYGAFWTTNLLAAPQVWTLYPPEKTGTGSAVSFSVTNDVPGRSYRTGVRLP